MYNVIKVDLTLNFKSVLKTAKDGLRYPDLSMALLGVAGWTGGGSGVICLKLRTPAVYVPHSSFPD